MGTFDGEGQSLLIAHTVFNAGAALSKVSLEETESQILLYIRGLMSE